MKNRTSEHNPKAGSHSGNLAFLDDAGDPGFKFGAGSSRYFAVASVVFADSSQAAAVSNAIRQFKINKGWSKKYELKFHDLRKDHVAEILKAVCSLDFRIRGIVVDKTLVTNHQMRTRPEAFYNYIVKEVLARDSQLTNAKVWLDGKAGKEYKQRTIAYFRKKVNRESYKIADFDYADSKENNLIQLADLVVGSIYRSKQINLKDYKRYLDILTCRLDELGDFE
jgi:formyltetrahydrofolate synthetase